MNYTDFLIGESVFNGRKIGIALGGGGARGFSHLGVLKVLEAAEIIPDVVVGTSMGSVVGALYAQSGKISSVLERLQLLSKESESEAKAIDIFPQNQKGDHFFDQITREIKQRLVINLSISKKSLLPSSRIEDSISTMIEDVSIEDMPITFAAMASDLISGKGIILDRGSLRKAVVASSSIPGFFPPVKWNDFLLIDGEATDLIPVNACYLLGADLVIAVDVRRTLQTDPQLRHTIDIFLRSVQITGCHLANTALERADFVLHPVSDDVQWSEFERMSELINAGEWEARAKLPQLLELLHNKHSVDRKKKLETLSGEYLFANSLKTA